MKIKCKFKVGKKVFITSKVYDTDISDERITIHRSIITGIAILKGSFPGKSKDTRYFLSNYKDSTTSERFEHQIFSSKKKVKKYLINKVKNAKCN